MLPELKKLGIIAGQKILVHRAPKAFTQDLRDTALPDTLISTRLTTRAQYDLIFHFAAPDENLDALFPQIARALKDGGALWLIMPKQKQARQLGFRYDWNAMRTRALKTTLVDNKTLAFSPDEHGTRFVLRQMPRP